jgi:hypothetical protein
MRRREPDQASLAAAFETNERARARSFLELLAESGRDLRQGVDPALLERDRDLEKRLSAAAERQMRVSSGAGSSDQPEAVSAEINDLTRERPRGGADPCQQLAAGRGPAITTGHPGRDPEGSSR